MKKTVDQLGCLHPRLNLVVKGRADLDKPNEVEVCTRDNLAGPTAEAVEKMNKDRYGERTMIHGKKPRFSACTT